MTDSKRDNLKSQQNVDPESFARFLELLSADPEQAGCLYTRLHKKLVGFFNLKGVADSADAADETIDRAVIKINAGTPVSDAGNYCLGIARNIAKERLRLEWREQTTFVNFIKNLADNSDQQVERIKRLLKPCFEQLVGEEQQLLMAYCQIARGRARMEHRRQLALNMETTVLALRMRVTRLRDILRDCVRKRSNDL
jgi:DNA-directed RNA polymerase specialized sigma24 family protein